jgi:hypothetical protein
MVTNGRQQDFALQAKLAATSKNMRREKAACFGNSFYDRAYAPVVLYSVGARGMFQAL